MWDIYRDTAAEHGYQAGPENFGYLIPTFVADSEEKAQELGAGFVYGGGQNAFSRPEYTLPPGYNSRAAIRRLAAQPGGSWLGVNRRKLMGQATDSKDDTTDYDEVRQKLRRGYQKAQDNYQTLVGTPDTIIPKVKKILQTLRPGIFTFFHVQGPVSNEDRMRSLELIANEVVPEIRAYGKEIGLTDPAEREPGSVKLREGEKPAEVVDRSALQEIMGG